MNPEKPNVPVQPKLNELAPALPIEQPEPLLTFLAERGIQTLADVRGVGSLGRMEGLPLAADHPAVRRLEALANLSAVSPDAGVSSALIERGYDSLLAIARVPRTEFIAAVRDQVGDFKAARMHVEAHAQTMYLNNALTGILAARANGHSIVPYGDVQAIEGDAQKCGCKDCEAAVSPLAYLADLLDYVQKHIKRERHGLQREYIIGSNPPIAQIDPILDFHQEGENLPGFKVRWTGSIRPRYTERYTFYTRIDGFPELDVTLWVNSQKLIDDDAQDLPAEFTGVIDLKENELYDIKMELDASNGVSYPSARLDWSSPSQLREVVPASQLFIDPINIDLQFLVDFFHQPFDKLPASCEAADEQFLQARLCIEALGSYLASLAGLKAEYYDDTNFSKLKMTRIDPTVDFEWGTGSPDASIAPDAFSVRWIGQIIPQFSDTYTFTTTSDDGVRLWIDGQLIIDNWTVHQPMDNSVTIALTAGKAYDLKLELYEDQGGATIKLFWQRSSEGKSIVPASQLRPFSVAQSANLDKAEKDYLLAAYTSLLTRLGTSFAEIRLARSADIETRKALAERLGIDLDLRPGNGLKGEYFEDMHFSSLKFIRRDPTINFEWQLESPDPSIAPDHFAVRWWGQVEPEFTGTYTFYTISDDSVRLWVNGKLLIDNWTIHLPTENRGTIDLIGGRRYDIMLEYYENEGGATIKLLWECQGQPKEIIPQNRLYSNPTNTLDALLLDPDAVQTKPETLTEEKLEALFGLRDTSRDPLTEPPTSLLQQWRLEHLRTLWREQDWPTDPYSHDYQPQEERLPTIDPDLNDADDFRVPIKKANSSDPDKPFDIWLKRRDWVDQRLQDFAILTKERRGQIVPDLGNTLGIMKDDVTYPLPGDTTPSTPPISLTPWPTIPDLDKLRRDLTQATDDKTRKDAVDSVRKDLHLTVESFTRLMDLRDKDTSAESDPRYDGLTSEEWQEVYSILTQATKVAFYGAWMQEEQGNDETQAPEVRLGPADFWFSLREPVEVDWPPLLVGSRPLIDPERVSDVDLTKVIPGKAALVLWQARRAQLDQMHKNLKAKREDPINGGFLAMLTLALGTPPSGNTDWDPILTQLYNDLNSGDVLRSNHAKTRIKNELRMTVGNFVRLMEVKAQDAESDPNKKPSAQDYEEVNTILTSVQKLRAEYANWANQESQLPLIDPEYVKTSDLAEPTAGKDALELWYQRRAALGTDYQALKSNREQQGLDETLALALGLPPSMLQELDQLYEKLLNETGVEIITQKITTGLYMTVEDFKRLIRIKIKSQDSKSASPTTTEWAEVYAILTSAQKMRVEYPNWLSEEQHLGLTTQNYWRVFKAALPRWRASAEARQQWRQALCTRSSAPINDPDQVVPGYLKNPVKDDVAFDLWTKRNVWLNNADPNAGSPGLWQKLQAAQASGGLDAMIELETVKPTSDLWKLDDERSKGNDIVPRLEQFSLDNSSFSYLLRIRNLITDNQSVLSAEWDAVYSILVQVSKRRKFAEWREQEQQAGLTLSPDFFRFPEEDKTVFPPPPPPWEPVAWRSTWEMRRDWQDTLQARMDQEEAVKDALQSAVSATEEVTLPMLRDALIIATDAKGTTLEEKAKQITDRLLIDTRVSGCQMTTRVAQTIETIQGLLWSVRTGQLRDTYPDLYLAAPDFDEEWEWIGSYASWRAAMFVFMYPENILLPSLRMHQTPTFRALVNELRNNRRLTPKQARTAARIYSDYFRDICTLKIEAVLSRLTLTQDMDYFFARAGATNTVYWSTYDPSIQSDYAHSFWETVPNLENVIWLIGAVRYTTDPKERYIYLLAWVNEKGQQKLAYIKYDLEEGHWKGGVELIDLPVPEFGYYDDNGLVAYVLPPQSLGLIPGKKPIYRLAFPKYGYHCFVTESEYAQMSNSLRKEGVLCYVYNAQSPGTKPLYRYRDNSVSIEYGAHTVITTDEDAPDEFKKEFRYIAKDVMGYVPIVPTARETPLYYMFKRSWKSDPAGWELDYFHTTDVLEWARTIAGQFKKFSVGTLPPLLLQNVTGPFDITEQLTEAEIQNRRGQIEKVFRDNVPGLRSNLTYLEEAYYFVPLYLALQLRARGQYIAALDWFRTIYDYSAPLDQRKIYYGLVHEEYLTKPTSQHPDWSDPLNPHSIAETRPNTYTRYTLFSLIRCFLEYADAEFTRDTAESVPRARTLYLTALELLDTLLETQQPESCEALIASLDAEERQTIQSDAPQWLPVWFELKKMLAVIPDSGTLDKAVNGDSEHQIVGVRKALNERPWWLALWLARQSIEKATAAPPATPTMAEVLYDKTRLLDKAYTALLTSPVLAEASLAVGNVAGNRFLQSVSTASDISMATLEREKVDLPLLRTPLMNLAKGQHALTTVATTAPSNGASVNNAQVDVLPSFGYVPILSFQFCIPPNPVLNALKLHAELNLYKLRNCRNIAGMQRQIDAYAAPTNTTSGLPMIGASGQLILPGTVVLQPTPYRYKVLIERAKQLVGIAQQMEAAMLSALEKRDIEAYNLLKARQDVRMARAGVQLQNLRVKEAEDGVDLANLQQERAQIEVDYYQGLLNEPLSILELGALFTMGLSAALQVSAAEFGFMAAAAYGYTGVRAAEGLSASASGVSSLAAATSTSASILSTLADYERRRQGWEFQRTLAQQDVKMGAQQMKVAEDNVRVVGQERAIAEMQTEYAEAMVEFLSTKFPNVELYEWMSGVLENVYSFFLQQATSVAKLAENQLAFERQETPPSCIQSDYWEAPSDEMGVSGDGRAPDRHGLTGSARLLQDIYLLDQYAFENDKRKLQLSKTISLARMAPYEFQRFRETGVLNFATPMDLFDRDFPGHYLRLIKRVRTSVVALIPPMQGIHATLTNGGQSRVVIGPEVFQTVVVRRDPESVALTAPINASGLFELEPQSEMLFPFEGLGVSTNWEFRMPLAANLFDFNTIADVLLTIEYTALDSFDYRQQVIQTLPSMISGNRPFIFRQGFADAWYDLHNPDQATPPAMTVTFETRREDFPPNITDLKIQHVLLYFACTDKRVFEENVTLKFKAKGENNAVGGEAKPNDGVISTQIGNAGSWSAMTNKKSPAGVWTLSLRDTPENRKLFTDEVIEDILLVITYSGRTPEWPN